MDKINILVLGKSGQVARELARAAWPSTWRVTCAGRDTLDLITVDAGSLAAKLQNEDISIAINAAGYTAVDQAETESEQAFALNAEAPDRVADACSSLGIPLIYLSTDYVFDGGKSAPYVETDPVNPISVYGKSKAAGETAVRQRHAQHIILRTAWVFSPFGQNFVKTMLRLGAERDELSVVDDQHGSPTAARDVAQAIVQLTQRVLHDPDAPYGTFHFAGTPPVSRYEFACEIFRQAGDLDWPTPKAVHPIATDGYPAAAPRPNNAELDCAKIGAAYGIAPPNWAKALENCLQELAQSRKS